MKIHALIIDDRTELISAARSALEGSDGVSVECVASHREAMQTIGDGPYDALLLPSSIMDARWLEVLELARSKNPDIPQIILSNRDDEEPVVSALNSGDTFSIPSVGDTGKYMAELVFRIRNAVSHQRSELRLKKLTRHFLILSNVNHSIVHATDQDELLSAIGRIFVSLGPYRLACAGGAAAHTDQASYRVLHEKGGQKKILTEEKNTIADLIRGDDPAGVIIPEIRHCRDRVPFSEDAAGHGCTACGIFPVRPHNLPVTALFLYAPDTEIFDDEERRTIETVTANLAHAIDSLDQEQRRKQAEEALKQVVKKLNLMSSITRHDVLNQVTVLKGYLDLIEMDPDGFSNPDTLNRMKAATGTIHECINFTSMYQKIGAYTPAWQNVHDVVGRTVRTIDTGTIEVENRSDSCWVYADPLLEKVFYNLIDNSLSHAGVCTRIRFSTRKGDNGGTIVYEDNGDGIPTDQKELIFDKGVGRKTGFGLFLAREILSITGLSILENGTPGEGARFEIEVPENGFRRLSPD
ncbi:ATP-binding protein [Methanofollis fontis]|nr:ATP-binding protein [Methanofollis fontis]